MAAQRKRRRHHREAPEIGAAARRMVRALVKRGQAGDWEALEELAALESFTREAVGHALVLMHDTGQQYSWTELGDVLGVSRQAAEQRANRARGTLPPALAALLPADHD